MAQWPRPRRRLTNLGPRAWLGVRGLSPEAAERRRLRAGAPMTSSAEAPRTRVIARNGSPSGSRFISQGMTTSDPITLSLTGIVRETGKRSPAPCQLRSQPHSNACLSERIDATSRPSYRIGKIMH